MKMYGIWKLAGRSRYRQCIAFYVLSLMIHASVALVTTTEQVVSYLQQYGYLKKHTTLDSGPSQVYDLRSAILQFQQFAGLQPTGELNAETLAKMSQSRCGVPDVIPNGKRRRRFAIGGSSWLTNRLAYGFRNYSMKIDQQTIRKVISKALQLWGNASAIEFIEVSSVSMANIQLQFSILDHGDGYPFDGAGGVLAHTFYPASGYWSGGVHFDDDESWTDGVNRGTNLLQVATHELGHALGLAHSSDPNAVMQPYYGGYNPNFRLGQDDINGIVYLYGKFNQTSSSGVTAGGATVAAPTTTASTGTGSGGAMCNNATIDAIVSVGRLIYAFTGNKYYILENSSCCDLMAVVRDGFPRLLSDDWPGLTVSRIDAALYMNSTSTSPGYLYLFSGKQYWRFSKLPATAIDDGYPRNISSGFPGVPDDIDAAFVWDKNNRTYFIKGSQYYRYTNKQGVDRLYPRPLTLWSGLPNNQRIDAAFQSPDRKTYFFSGTSFYQFDDLKFQASSPLPTARYWFGCNTGR